jgi:predicted alpha-1,6-mannanase (GH76 family)
MLHSFTMRGRRFLARQGALAGLVALSACQTLLGIDGDRPLASDPLDGSVPRSDAAPDTGTGSADASSGGDATPPAEAGPPALDPTTANKNADQAVEAMLLAFWNPGNEYLVADTTPSATPADADLGSFSLAWDAVLDAAARHGGARFAGTVATLWNSQNALGWGFSRYDEESLMTLALLRLYDLTGSNTYLLEARTLYEDVKSAWNTTCCTTPPGGIWHDAAHTRKTATANAAAAIAGAALFERTQISAYLSFAQQVYDYWASNLVDPTTHQVANFIAPPAGGATTGAVDRTKYTVNEGLMIGAAVEIAKATQDTSTLALAHQIAGFMLANETATAPQLGAVLSDGDDTTCLEDCPQYKGIAARYVGALYASDTTHAEYRDLLLRSAGAAWTVARDATSGPTAGLFNTDWASSFAGTGTLGATASAAIVLSTAARVAGPPPADTPGTYEAEEGVLGGVGLSDQNPAPSAPFDGWGYVSGWGCGIPCMPAGSHDGDSVGFLIATPAASLWALRFAYLANGIAGPYNRQLLVNGATFATVAFPATGATWGSSQSVLNVPLSAGHNTVSLVYDATQGGAGIIDLDSLRVSQNLLKAQPVASKWGNSFCCGLANGLHISDTSASFGGASVAATRWQDSNVPSGNWLKIYPNDSPFLSNLVPGQWYVASMTVSGAGCYHLDFYDGATDISTPATLIGSSPQTFTTQVFKLSSTSPPEFQLRIDPPPGSPIGMYVDADITMWNLAIYPAQ